MMDLSILNFIEYYNISTILNVAILEAEFLRSGSVMI